MNSKTNSFQPGKDDAGRFMSIPVLVKRPYLVITKFDENNLGGVRKLIQRATKLYFTKIFEFQHLLGKNRLSIEVQQSGLGSSVEPRLIEVMHQLHTTTRGTQSMLDRPRMAH